MYKLLNNGFIYNVKKNITIPADKTLPEYRDYLEWIANGNIAEPILTPSEEIAELKKMQKFLVNAGFSQAIGLLVSQYPQDEISSWPKQEQEARAYVANNAAPTPLLDSIAAVRQIAKSELVQRIIAKAELYAQISGQLIGYRQKLEDQLDALPANATKTQIEAVVWVTPS